MSDNDTRRRQGINIAGRLIGEKPEFPPVYGADRIDEGEKNRIGDAAWQNANGNPHAYQQLIAQHLNGEIDLFSDAPTAIGGGRALPRTADRRLSSVPVQGGSSDGVGSDRLTATGGETHGLEGPAQAFSGVSSVAGVAAPEPQPAMSRVGRAGSQAAAVGGTGAPIGETGTGSEGGPGSTGEGGETR